MKIGIEHEVWVLDQQCTLMDILGGRPSERYNQYTVWMTSSDWEELKVAYDKEYYGTQYEVKFAPFTASEENIWLVSDFFWKLYSKHDCIQNNGPDFVWTHIHIFNDYSPTHKWLFNVMALVFKEMADFWKGIYEDEWVSIQYKVKELKRLVTSNNLLKFFDCNVLSNQLRKIHTASSFSFQYRDIGNDRPKYAPVIWSPSRGWKAYSLELRYISNTYFLLEDPAKIRTLIQNCVDTVNVMTSEPIEVHKDSIQIAIKSILTSYITLTALLYGTQNNRSLRHVEEMIRELLPLAELKISEGRLSLITEINMNMIPDGDIYQRFHSFNRPTPIGQNSVFFDETENDWDDSDGWGDDESDESDESEEEVA